MTLIEASLFLCSVVKHAQHAGAFATRVNDSKPLHSIMYKTHAMQGTFFALMFLLPWDPKQNVR